MENKKLKVYLLLGFIVAFGFFVRIYNINNAPPGIYPDEAVNGEDAWHVIDNGGKFEWFYPANQGREGLFMNLIAICFWIFGASPLTLKLPAILSGTLTIFGTYLLTRELFNKERLALAAATLVSVSFWAINFNRISFRANMLPLVLVFAFYFLWKGLRTQKWQDFAYGGLIFGLGLHTYIAFRVAPLILIPTVISLFFSRPNFIREYWKKILIFVLFTTLAAAPMLYTFLYAHPEYLESRSGSISVLSPQVNHGHLITTFLRSFGLSLIKYNFVGDMNWRHNFPPHPLLDTLSGIGFLFGIIYAFRKAIQLWRSRFSQKKMDLQMDVFTFLIAWFFVMLIPEFMTAEGNPHALRAIGTLPVVFIFSAFTLDFFLKKSEDCSYVTRQTALYIATAILVFIGFFNVAKYHYFWATRPETARSFEKVVMDVNQLIKVAPTQQEKFVITGSMQRIPLKIFNWNSPYIQYFYPNEVDKINPKDKNDFIVLMTEKNDAIFSSLKKRFPRLELDEMQDQFGITYYLLK